MADRIKGITVEINGDTTGLSKALQGVNKEIRNTQSQLKDVNKLLKLDPGNTELITQKHKLLQQAVEETKKKLQSLKEAQKQADEALKNGTITQEQYDGLQREIEETTQKLKSLEDQANQSATAVQKIAAAGDKMKTIGGKLSGVGKDLTMYVSAPLAAAGAAGVKSFADVDKTMALANKTMGNTAEQANTLNDAMKDAAANSTYGMQDAATATLNFARAGLDAEQSAAALAPAMNLAAGEGGDLDTVSAGLVATINGFHGSFEDAGTYADVFASACNNSALDVNSLSSAMSVAAPIFASAGYQVNDAALYMGIMANNGIEADKAANSLKTGIARLVSPAKEGADMMEQLGISVTNSDGSMKDSVTIQKELHDAFANLSESEQIAAASAIFGKNQMAPWLALINTAPGDVDKLNGSLSTCSGTTKDMADTMMSGFGGSMEKLKSSVDVLVYSLGQALAPTIQKVVDFLQGLVDKFNSLSPAQQDIIVKIGLAVAALGPLLMITGKLMSAVGSIMTAAPQIAGAMTKLSGLAKGLTGALGGIAPVLKIVGGIGMVIGGAITAVKNFVDMFKNGFSVIKSILMGVGIAIAAVGAVLLGAPAAVAAIVAAIVFVVANLVVLIKEHWTEIVTFVKGVWNEMKLMAKETWEGIKNTISGILTGIKTGVTNAWNAVKTATDTIFNAIKTFITTIWNGIKTVVTTVVNGVKTAVSTAWNAVKTTTSNIFNGIKNTVTTIWNGIRTAVTTAVSGIKTGISNGLNAAKNTVTNILNGIKNAFSNVWNGAKNIVSGAIEKIKGMMNFHWSLPKLKLPHFSISGKFSLDPPSIPHIGVEWYRKAMGDGMILNSPTIFGAAGGKLLGGGEAGAEAIVGVSSLRGMIQEAVAGQTSALVTALGASSGDIVIPVYIGNTLLDEMVVSAQNRRNLRSGGR